MLRLLPRRWLLVLFASLTAGGLAYLLHRSARGPHDPPPSESAAVVWAFEAERRGGVVSAPLVAGDRVFASAIHSTAFRNAGAVYGLDRATGKVVWRFDDAGRMQHTCSGPCLADGRLYVGEGMHANFTCKLYCLDAASGRKLWDFTAEGHVESGPCAAGGRVFFGAGDDGLYCLDAASGEKRWQLRGPFHIDSSPAVSGKRVYTGSGVSLLHRTTEAMCLDAEDGKVLWRVPTDLPVWSPPAVDGDEVFFGLGNGRLQVAAQPPERPAGALLCLGVEDGHQRWRFDTADAVFGGAALSRAHVFFGSREGRCYCLERRTGRLCWKYEAGSPVMTAPAYRDGRLYVVSTAGRVCCLDAADGRVRWGFDVAAHTRASPKLYSSPVVVDGPGRRVYFGGELEVPGGNAAVVYCLREGP